ncbi:MAG: hypothetical protein U9M90_00815 [Patescibacteria group bacterium]|nr:hypothetical protein [Patescibacteria group bacterium]
MDEKDETGKTKKIIFITLLVMCAVVGLVMFFVIIPSINKMYSSKDELEENKLHFESIKQDVAKEKSYSDLLINIKNNENLLENALIKSGAEVAFIEKIEAIGSEAGNGVEIKYQKIEPKRVKVSVVKQDKETIEKQKRQEQLEKSRINLLITVKGDYGSFLEFIYKLENLPHVFKIESVMIDKGSRSRILTSNEDRLPNYTEGKILISFIPAKSCKE